MLEITASILNAGRNGHLVETLSLTGFPLLLPHLHKSRQVLLSMYSSSIFHFFQKVYVHVVNCLSVAVKGAIWQALSRGMVNSEIVLV